MMTTKRSEALEQRKQELQFIGTHYAMNGLEAPKEIGEEYAKILEELEREKAKEAREEREKRSPRA